MPIHDIHMNPVRARAGYGADFIAKICKVG
jgi:hypothetical protein